MGEGYFRPCAITQGLWVLYHAVSRNNNELLC
jgi:hypothetical protein